MEPEENEEHAFQKRESEVSNEKDIDNDEDSETLGALIHLDDDFNMTIGNIQ
jgi:hypothetical protein